MLLDGGNRQRECHIRQMQVRLSVSREAFRETKMVDVFNNPRRVEVIEDRLR